MILLFSFVVGQTVLINGMFPGVVCEKLVERGAEAYSVSRRWCSDQNKVVAFGNNLTAWPQYDARGTPK